MVDFKKSYSSRYRMPRDLPALVEISDAPRSPGPHRDIECTAISRPSLRYRMPRDLPALIGISNALKYPGPR
eukprot:4344916-Prymnesium_polylepis.1